MQDDMLMKTSGLKSKPEVEFQYGGGLFSKTGTSNSHPQTKIAHQNLVCKWILTFLIEFSQ